MPYWLWFASGALFYEWQRTDKQLLFWCAIAIGFAASLPPIPGAGEIPNMQWFPLIGFPFVVLFAAGMTSSIARKSLSHPALLFFGAISYPLYLIHEEALIGLSQLLPLGVLAPIMAALPLIAAAWIIARYWEYPVRSMLAFPVLFGQQRSLRRT